MTLQNTAYFSKDLGAPTTVPIGNGFEVSFIAARITEDRKGVYLNDMVFFAAHSTELPGTGRTVLSVFRQMHGLKSTTTALDYQAIYLLHELGHLMGGLVGNKDNFAASSANTIAVIQACFPQLLN